MGFIYKKKQRFQTKVLQVLVHGAGARRKAKGAKSGGKSMGYVEKGSRCLNY